MNKLSTEKRIQVVAALVEGNSIRATCRMTVPGFRDVEVGAGYALRW